MPAEPTTIQFSSDEATTASSTTETTIDAEALARWMDANGVPGDGELPALGSLTVVLSKVDWRARGLKQCYSRLLAGAAVDSKVEAFGPLVPELIRKAASLAATIS